jgi:hypothetical protein
MPVTDEEPKTVVELTPSFAEAHCNLGTLYEAEGHKAEAIQHYAAAKRLLKGKLLRSD